MRISLTKTTTLKQRFFVFLIALALSGILILTRDKDEGSIKTLTIYSLKGPSGVGMIRLFEEPPAIPGFNVKMEALAQAELMAARFISGEAGVGVLPPNAAAKIASSGRDIRAAAITGTGSLSLLSSDPELRRLEDLKGRTVQAVGQGLIPEYVFRKILTAHGLMPDQDVKLNYSLSYPEIAQSLIAGRVSIALLPEPFVTMALMGRPDLNSITDIQKEWADAAGAGENYPLTIIAVDGAFADANAAALKEILNAVKNSIEWVIANPAAAGALVEKHNLGISAAVSAAAIPKSNYVFIPAREGRPSMEALFRAFLESAPASIGGSLPGNRFYWKK